MQLPQWLWGAFVLILGLMLWLGALSDATGELRMPGVGSIFYFAVVIGLAALLVRRD
jgi:hypothetical protein